MKRKKKYQLTNSELTLMEILWQADRPLNRQEILEAATTEDGQLLFAVSSLHLLINDLMDKNYIAPMGGAGKDTNYGRRFAPLVTRNEHFAIQITSTEQYTPEDIPSIVCSLAKYSGISDLDGLLQEIEKTIRKKKGEGGK
ncbi:MAG TPA: BlaI/MecI/CopY family transcriptional regulator [Candidatus Acutalibacter pullicola]|uniref:BlaI/MecI/CopY family transcriptional regulator n=1 Tax=Candidatus Acutalibacter pullicola TaxID=2838417 RepID=A0A9D2MX25_9FIRM|nr:BlaI/MecI/CopY family transcriptional regulator [Candidatus Acutalibacter pullicola]